MTSIDTAPFGAGLWPDSSPAGRVRNRELNENSMNGLFAPVQSLLVKQLANIGAKELTPFLLARLAGQVLSRVRLVFAAELRGPITEALV